MVDPVPRDEPLGVVVVGLIVIVELGIGKGTTVCVVFEELIVIIGMGEVGKIELKAPLPLLSIVPDAVAFG